MGKYAFIDHIFGDDDTEEESNDAGLFHDDEPDADDDADDGAFVEDEAMLARLDKAFRGLRVRVRASTDLSELRTMRAENVEALAGPLSPTLRMRTRDLVEEIDDRVTELRARRARSD